MAKGNVSSSPDALMALYVKNHEDHEAPFGLQEERLKI